jgi:hypothetical protein
VRSCEWPNCPSTFWALVWWSCRVALLSFRVDSVHMTVFPDQTRLSLPEFHLSFRVDPVRTMALFFQTRLDCGGDAFSQRSDVELEQVFWWMICVLLALAHFFAPITEEALSCFPGSLHFHHIGWHPSWKGWCLRRLHSFAFSWFGFGF